MATISLPTNLSDVSAENEFKIPAPGEYTFEVKKAEIKQSKAGNTMVNVGCQIIDDDEFEGSYVFETLVFTEKALFKVKQFLLSCGLDADTSEIDTDEWIGCTFNAVVNTEEYEDRNGETKEKAVITKYIF
jgi:acetoin utilization deacetylase AcuC-like enzyme